MYGLVCICGTLRREKEGEICVGSLVDSGKSQREGLWRFIQHTAVETSHAIHYNPSGCGMKKEEFNTYVFILYSLFISVL
jgi:hypothetical protein